MSEGNFKIRAVDGNKTFEECFEIGETYRVIDGILYDKNEGKHEYEFYGSITKLYSSITEINQVFGGDAYSIYYGIYGRFEYIEECESPVQIESKSITIEISIEKAIEDLKKLYQSENVKILI